MRICLLILGLVSVLTCGPAAAQELVRDDACQPEFCQPADVVRVEEGIDLVGYIDADAAERTISSLRPHDTLFLTSIGGDAEATLRLGEIVRERGLTVVVPSRCQGYCALHVFLPAVRKSTGEGGTVIFGASAALDREISLARPDLFSPDQRVKVDRMAEREGALLTKAGIDPALLVCMRDAMRLDYDGVYRLPDAAPFNTSRYSRFAGGGYNDTVMFSKAVLDAYGVREVDAINFRSGPDDYIFFLSPRFKTVWIDAPGKPCNAYPKEASAPS